MIQPADSPDILFAMRRLVRQTRREATSRSLESFCSVYLPHYFTLPFCSMHRTIIGALEDAAQERNKRLAIAVPRGYGKTSLVAVAHCLWATVCRAERHTLLVVAGGDDRHEVLEAIRDEFADNRALRADWPRETRLRRQRSADLITEAGARIGVIERFGRVRNRRHGGVPPTLVILDEIERPESESQEHERAASERFGGWLDEWLPRDLAPDANVVVTGSIVREKSLLTDLVDHALRRDWTKLAFMAERDWPDKPDLWEQWGRIHRGMEAHGGEKGPAAARAMFEERKAEMLPGLRPLWPQKHEALALRELRLTIGEDRFECEMQNDPVNQALSKGPRRPFACGDYYDKTLFKPDGWPGEYPKGWILMAIDPECLLPLARRRFPEMVTVTYEKATGRKEVFDEHWYRRRIHSRIDSHTLAMIRRRAAKGLPLLSESDSAVRTPPWRVQPEAAAEHPAAP